MSDLEPRRDAQAQTPPATAEPWSVWWSWTVRLSGLAIMGHQAFFEQEDRQWLLLCAMGMMLGEIGLKAGLRFLLRQGGGQ